MPEASSGGWPAIGLDTEREWRPAGRVPRRDRGVRYRPAVPALIAQLHPPLSPETLTLVERAALRLRTVDEQGANGPIAVPLLRTESSASSKIEHIHVGQRHIGRALASLPTRQRSAAEVAANVNALQAAVDDATGPIDASSFDRLHAILLPAEAWAGRVRTEQNWVGGSDYSPRDARFVPPEPARVPGLIDDLAAFVRRDDLSAITQAAIAHAQFEVIHPYEDGNGRVGRAIAHLILRRREVVVHGTAPLSIALLADRQRYFDDLSAYERGDVDQFVAGFARSGLVAADAVQRLAADLSSIRREWAELPAVARARGHATVRQLVEDLVAHPVCTINQVAQRYDVSHEAARRTLEALVDAGVLNRTTAARNLHIYEATAVFDAIEDLERSLSSP